MNDSEQVVVIPQAEEGVVKQSLKQVQNLLKLVIIFGIQLLFLVPFHINITGKTISCMYF